MSALWANGKQQSSGKTGSDGLASLHDDSRPGAQRSGAGERLDSGTTEPTRPW
jgi:hypothetical protein